VASSVVIIEERTGRKRRIELVGACLPLQGANWSGRQALSTSWNPGNTEATQHVLGPQEMPSNWDFKWSTVRMRRSPATVVEPNRGVEFQVGRAFELAQLLEEVMRGGALLQVSWISSAANQNSSARQVRLGRAEDWDFNFDRPDDIEGNISFSWIGRGAQQPKTSAIRGEDVGSAIQAAINAANAAVDAIEAQAIRSQSLKRGQPDANTFTLGQLESIANGPIELVDSFARTANGISNRLKRIGDVINKVKETPAAVLGRLVDVANNGVSVANQFTDALTREGPETQSTRNKVNTLTRNASYFSGAQTQADLMAKTMEKLAEAARRRQNSAVPSAGNSRRQDQTRTDDNFRVHVPRDGDTMASIAQKFYGSPDLGDELAVANGLPSYTITPPRMPIIIPTRRNLEEANRDRV
jgi:uncharacterized protein YidB (DUF937 family)